LIGFDLAAHMRITFTYSSLSPHLGHAMVSSITYYEDVYTSSSWARSVNTIACARRNQFAPNPLRTTLGGAPHTFGSRPDIRMALRVSLARARSE
jgi:hypothetical protein